MQSLHPARTMQPILFESCSKPQNVRLVLRSEHTPTDAACQHALMACVTVQCFNASTGIISCCISALVVVVGIVCVGATGQ